MVSVYLVYGDDFGNGIGRRFCILSPKPVEECVNPTECEWLVPGTEEYDA